VSLTLERRFSVAEFFAGGGMVRAALGPGWHVALANDIDPKKCECYRRNWGDTDLIEGDVGLLNPILLRQPIDLYWASSPCQDFSLAGQRRGMAGARSGVFEKWVSLVADAAAHGFSPRIIAFENVTGLLTSNGGRDFEQVITSFVDLGYRVGAVEIDARNFVPQSRPRLFVIAVRRDVALPGHILTGKPIEPFHSRRLRDRVGSLSLSIRSEWLWWDLPVPEASATSLESCLDTDVAQTWFPADEVERLLGMMTDANLFKLESAKAMKRKVVGTLYRRGRPDASGVVRQRVEVRFDGVAGCLRTPAGGSSRQTLVFVDEHAVTMRLLSPREAATLMGLPQSYVLPQSFNEAYKISGDGVVVPVVKYLRDRIFDPILKEPLLRLAA